MLVINVCYRRKLYYILNYTNKKLYLINIIKNGKHFSISNLNLSICNMRPEEYQVKLRLYLVMSTNMGQSFLLFLFVYIHNVIRCSTSTFFIQTQNYTLI
jgi:hypothetical protein